MEAESMKQTPAAADVPRLSLTGEPVLYDRRGYPRSIVTLPEFRRGVAPGNKGKTYPAEILTPDEVYALINACGKSSMGLRNQALIIVMWRSGLRIAEALALQPKDIDWVTGRVTVLRGKGGKRRVSVLDPHGLEYVARWRERRQKLGYGPGPLFCCIQGPTAGQALGSPYVRTRLKFLAEKVGIDKSVRPHVLRHSFASYLAEAGTPVQYLQKVLGHSSLAVTQIYIDHLSPGKVLDFVAEVDWPEAA